MSDLDRNTYRSSDLTTRSSDLTGSGPMFPLSRHRVPQTDDFEQEATFAFTVRLRSFGRPSKLKIDLAKSLGLACYNAFGDRFEMELQGQQITFDPLAHDGEHEGHDQAVRFS